MKLNIKKPKKWVDNPFKKDTPVDIFSNATEADWWKDKNCHQCVYYESESTEPEEAGCVLAWYIDLGYILGEIPLWVAKEIGCEYNPLYQRCRLHETCRHRWTEEDAQLPF